MIQLLENLFRLNVGSKMKPFEGIPGPTPQFPLGNAQDFIGQVPWEVCADYGEKYGGITQVWLFRKPALVLNDPELIEQVLITRQDLFYKDRLYKAACPMMSQDSLFIQPAQDQSWQFIKENHPLSMPYVHQWQAEQIPILKHQFEADIERLVARSQQGSFPLFDAIHRLTFDGFARATVGRTLGDRAFEAYNTMAKVADKRLKTKLPYPDEPRGIKYRLASRQWFAYFDEIVREARQNPTGDDLLSWMIREGGSQLSDTALAHAFAELYFSGAVSTPSGITYTLYLLDQNPDCLSTLMESFQSIPMDSLNLEHLEQCLPLEQSLLESLRIFPPVCFFARNVVKDKPIAFAGYHIPPNTPMLISNWYLHHHPSYWQNPWAYKPARWDTETRSANPLGSGYFFPFGRGLRMCLGMPFALIFIKLALATILSQVRVRFDADSSAQGTFYVGAMAPFDLKGVVSDQ